MSSSAIIRVVAMQPQAEHVTRLTGTAAVLALKLSYFFSETSVRLQIVLSHGILIDRC